MRKPKVRFVPGWRRCWRWFSVNVPAVNVAFLSTWAMLPSKFQDALPVWAVLVIAVALIVAGMFGRLIEQESRDV